MGEEESAENKKEENKTEENKAEEIKTKAPLSEEEKQIIYINKRKSDNNILIKKMNNYLNSKVKKVNQIHKKSNEKIQLQKSEINKINKKYDEIKTKTKNIIKLMKTNPTFNSIGKDYKKTAKNIDDKTKEIQFLNKKVENLNAEMVHLLREIKSIEDKKDLDNIEEIKNINIERKLNIEGQLNSKELIADEMKLGDIKVSNNYIHLEENFKIFYKNKVMPVYELINFNTKVRTLKNNCGKNMDCFVTKAFIEQKRQKDNLVEKSLENIRAHLKTLRK